MTISIPMNPINPELLIIMRWLDNSDSVILEQLEATSTIASDKVYGTLKGSGTFEFTNALSIDEAAYYTTQNCKILVDKWVDKYFEDSGEDKQTYINAIEGSK